MIELLYLTILTLVAAAVGWRILDAFRLEWSGADEKAIFSIAIGCGVFSYMMFALGVGGLLYRSVVVGVLSIIALLSLVKRGWFRSPWDLPRARSACRRDKLSLLVGSALLIAMAGNFVGTLAPISFADALAYHFAAPKVWIKAHYMSAIPGDWHSHIPFNVEMLFMLGMLLHSDVLGALFHWMFGVVVVVALCCFCRKHVEVVNPLIAAAVFYLSGLIAWESTSGFVDLGLTFFALLAVYAFLNWKVETEATGWLALSGVCAGLAAGSKYMGVVIPMLIVFLLIASLVAQGRVKKGVLPLLAFTLPAIALLTPWLARNLILTGDPVYPFLTALRGDEQLRTNLAGIVAYGYGKDLGDLFLAPFRMIYKGEAFSRAAEFLGPLYLSLLPPSLLVLPQNRTVRLLWFFLVACGVVWFFTSQQIRFLIPMLPLAAICCAFSVALLAKSGAMLRAVSGGVLFLGLSFGLLVTVVYNSQFVPVVFGLEPTNAFLSRKTSHYEDIQWMNKNLPENSRILFYPRNAYYLDRDYVKLVHDFKSEEFEEWVTDHRITHVYVACERCLEDLSSQMALKVLREGYSHYVTSRTWEETVKVPAAIVERLQ